MGLLDDVEKMAQKARDLAEEHPDQVHQGLDQVENAIDKQTGGKHASQIDSAGDKVADFLAPDAPKDASPNAG